MLLVVLEKAKHKYPFRLYGVCLMANHIHLLLKPQDASQLPKLMHWVGWYASIALNTLRNIHANPKAAGVRKRFYDPLFQLRALQQIRNRRHQ